MPKTLSEPIQVVDVVDDSKVLQRFNVMQFFQVWFALFWPSFVLVSCTGSHAASTAPWTAFFTAMIAIIAMRAHAYKQIVNSLLLYKRHVGSLAGLNISDLVSNEFKRDFVIDLPRDEVLERALHEIGKLHFCSNLRLNLAEGEVSVIGTGTNMCSCHISNISVQVTKNTDSQSHVVIRSVRRLAGFTDDGSNMDNALSLEAAIKSAAVKHHDEPLHLKKLQRRWPLFVHEASRMLPAAILSVTFGTIFCFVGLPKQVETRAWSQYVAGEYKQAYDTVTNFKGVHSDRLCNMEALSLLHLGRIDEAIAILKPIAETGDGLSDANLAYAYAMDGDWDNVLSMRDRLNTYSSLRTVSRVAFVNGLTELHHANPDEALRWFNNSISLADNFPDAQSAAVPLDISLGRFAQFNALEINMRARAMYEREILAKDDATINFLGWFAAGSLGFALLSRLRRRKSFVGPRAKTSAHQTEPFFDDADDVEADLDRAFDQRLAESSLPAKTTESVRNDSGIGAAQDCVIEPQSIDLTVEERSSSESSSSESSSSGPSSGDLVLEPISAESTDCTRLVINTARRDYLKSQK